MQISIRDGNRSSYNVDLSAINKDVISFGRQSDNDIVLKSDYVSRVHGVFYAEGSNFYVEDMDSTNGLFFNGQRFKRRTLHDGDVIFIRSNTGNQRDYVEIKIREAADYAIVNNNPQPYRQIPQQQYQPVQQQGFPNNAQSVVYQQNIYYGQPQGMKWYNFLIWALLFITSIYCAISAVSCIKSADFEDEIDYTDIFFALVDSSYADKLSDFYDGLSVKLYIFAAFEIIFAIYFVIVRMEFAKFKRNAFLHYAISYIALIIVRLIRLVTVDVYLMMSKDVLYEFVMGERHLEFTGEFYSRLITYIAVTLVYILANKDYFDKRKHLFVN